MSYLVTCAEAPTQQDGVSVCATGWQIIDATQTELLVAGGFDETAFHQAFIGVVLLWVAGLSVGLIVALLRKLKKG